MDGDASQRRGTGTIRTSDTSGPAMTLRNRHGRSARWAQSALSSRKNALAFAIRAALKLVTPLYSICCKHYVSRRNALTYNLLGPPALFAGDVILLEPGTEIISDVLRFNAAGTGGASYPASVLFYSHNFDGIDALADTGFMAAFYVNAIRLTEVGSEP